MGQIKCNHVSLGYNGNEIIRDLNFEVNAGDYLCIVGENGSGKSTLMRTILGLQEPMSGEIILGDELQRNEIGYLPQQTIVQKDFPASVWEVVLSGCQGRCGQRPFYSKEEKQLAADNIAKMGISGIIRKCYRELSGGQQQRVLLARALCATQKIILLDEPVSGLDPIVTAEMYELIRWINEEGITVIMISHDVNIAVDHASHVLSIGNRIFYGTREDYLHSEISELLSKGGHV